MIQDKIVNPKANIRVAYIGEVNAEIALLEDKIKFLISKIKELEESIKLLEEKNATDKVNKNNSDKNKK